MHPALLIRQPRSLLLSVIFCLDLLGSSTLFLFSSPPTPLLALVYLQLAITFCLAWGELIDNGHTVLIDPNANTVTEWSRSQAFRWRQVSYPLAVFCGVSSRKIGLNPFVLNQVELIVQESDERLVLVRFWSATGASEMPAAEALRSTIASAFELEDHGYTDRNITPSQPISKDRELGLVKTQPPPR